MKFWGLTNMLEASCLQQVATANPVLTWRILPELKVTHHMCLVLANREVSIVQVRRFPESLKMNLHKWGGSCAETADRDEPLLTNIFYDPLQGLDQESAVQSVTCHWFRISLSFDETLNLSSIRTFQTCILFVFVRSPTRPTNLKTPRATPKNPSSRV